ncbi:unnamed protein product [Parnassius apollo]|uniref:(apollo) hypothetical protein n=1 Tax=Parnassius apollo TaxID=110799 RepID=A0A8S3X4Q6_PARAO|nr:unnamed protein product [Parnassius apollo]
MFAATHSCFCDRVATSDYNKLSTPSQIRRKKIDVFNNTNCTKIECPTEEKRMCVKLINKREYDSKNIYIMVINKCEIGYIKCHKGLEAKVVPMKNCLHKLAIENPTKTHHNNYSGSGRNRRKFVSSFNKPQKKINYSKLYFGTHKRRDFSETEEEHSKVKEGDSNVDQSKDEKTASSNEDDNIQNNVIFQIREIDNGDESANEGSFVGDAEFEAKSDNGEEISPTNNKESQESEQEGSIRNVDETQNVDAEDQKSDNEVSLIKLEVNENINSTNGVEGLEPNEQDKESVESEITEENQLNEINTENTDDDSKNGKIMEYYELSEEDNKVAFSSELIKNNATGEKKSNTSNKTTHKALIDHSDVVYYNDVDKEQYNKDCPSVCPARDVMVCARKEDGEYKTFLSVCHLRKDNCDNPNYSE